MTAKRWFPCSDLDSSTTVVEESRYIALRTSAVYAAHHSL